jgi:hypothetical protein
MAVTQIELGLEPGDELAGAHIRPVDTCLFRQGFEILWGLSSLGFYVVQVGLK